MHDRYYTTVEQSQIIASILPEDSADLVYFKSCTSNDNTWKFRGLPMVLGYIPIKDIPEEVLPCWSLTALLKYLSKIKPQVYTPILFPSEGTWILQFAEHGHGNVCEVSCDSSIDACYEMILKLHKKEII